MLIFDGFPNKAWAREFSREVIDRFGVEARVFYTQSASDKHDPFPHKLVPPIVLVDRCDKEEDIESLVEDYGGSFAGT